MLKRTHMNALVSWGNKKDKKPLLVKGMRQVGKTSSIKQYAKEHYSNNHVYIDLFNPDHLAIFDSGFDNVFNAIKALMNITVNNETLIIIDEIQESETAYMFIKYLYDSEHPNNLICSGSYIENTVIQNNYKVPLGCYEELIIYPLTFYEFAINNGEESSLKIVESDILSNKPVNEAIHKKLLSLVDEYLIIGGMPNIVNTYINNIGGENVYQTVQDLVSTLKNQQEIDIQRGLRVSDKNKVLNIYRTIPKSMTDTNGMKLKKFKYSKLGDKNGNYNKYSNSIDVLTRSKVLISIYQVNNNYHDINNKNFKLVYSDMCFLTNSLGIITVKEIVKEKREEKGFIVENFVAIEIQQFSSEVKYWYKPKDPESKSNKVYEVDFLYYNLKTNQTVPIEVKSGMNTKKHSSINKYKSIYNPNTSIIISSKNFFKGKDKNDFTKIPLYAIWLLGKVIES